MKKSSFDFYISRKILVSILDEILRYYDSILADSDLGEYESSVIRDDYIILCRTKYIFERFPFDSLS